MDNNYTLQNIRQELNNNFKELEAIIEVILNSFSNFAINEVITFNINFLKKKENVFNFISRI